MSQPPLLCPRRYGAWALLLCVVASTGCAQFGQAGRPSSWRLPQALGGPADAKRLEKQLSMARLFEASKPTESRKIYQGLLREEGGKLKAHHRLAVMDSAEGKFADAEPHFQAALAIDPRQSNLLSDYGYMLYLQHRLPEAEKVLRDVLALEPRHQAATNNLAMVIGQDGRYDESLALFRQCVTDAEAHANLAFLMTQRGDFDDAKKCYSRALTLDPNLRSAATAMVQLAERESALRGRPIDPLPNLRHLAQGTPSPRPTDPAGAPMSGAPMPGAPVPGATTIPGAFATPDGMPMPPAAPVGVHAPADAQAPLGNVSAASQPLSGFPTPAGVSPQGVVAAGHVAAAPVAGYASAASYAAPATGHSSPLSGSSQPSSAELASLVTVVDLPGSHAARPARQPNPAAANQMMQQPAAGYSAQQGYPTQQGYAAQPGQQQISHQHQSMPQQMQQPQMQQMQQMQQPAPMAHGPQQQAANGQQPQSLPMIDMKTGMVIPTHPVPQPGPAVGLTSLSPIAASQPGHTMQAGYQQPMAAAPQHAGMSAQPSGNNPSHANYASAPQQFVQPHPQQFAVPQTLPAAPTRITGIQPSGY